MQDSFLISLIAVGVNLAGMLVIYSWMAFAFARPHWHRQGMVHVLATILAAGVFWIVPPLLLGLKNLQVAPHPLWLGNWLVSSFSVIVLGQAVRLIPRQLEDSARLDGLGRFGVYRHVILPCVRRELGLIALLTAMATSLLFWGTSTAPGDRGLFPPWLYLLLPMEGEHGFGVAKGYLALIGGSLVMTLPVILIYFLARGNPGVQLRPGRPNSSC
jgi:multiple sugar transport system permease protein